MPETSLLRFRLHKLATKDPQKPIRTPEYHKTKYKFTDYKKKYPYNIGQILDLSETVRLKTKSFCID